MHKKTIFLSLAVMICLLCNSAKSQQPPVKEYSIKYEVLTKKGETITVGYFDKNGNNAGTLASEIWTYSFTTTDSNQSIQVFTTGGQDARRRKVSKVWTKINIYVNGSLAKSVEGKALGSGPTAQVNLNDIK